ncbi:TPM domain-containing protein [Olleya sp. R77988]|uniref:TPM domain-containing protein n=1 Tax=Olleya sp. R77988 TaxID=3093875 RepID=UPI0037C8B604
MRLLSFLLIITSLVSCKKKNQNLIIKTVVNDYADIFTKTEEDSLSKIIIDYEKTSTNQICVYVIDSVPSLDNPVVYATKIANKLGVGQKEKDNGLLLLISKNDKKIAFATGYGTEKIVTDSICKRLIDSTLVPSFKKGNYFEGVLQALDTIKVKWED